MSPFRIMSVISKFIYKISLFIIHLMDIMWLENQSHVHILFIFIEINFYPLSFLCNVYNEVHEHMEWSSELWWDHNTTIAGL